MPAFGRGQHRTVRGTAIDISEIETDCAPGYSNSMRRSEGMCPKQYGPGFSAFAELLKEWHDKGAIWTTWVLRT